MKYKKMLKLCFFLLFFIFLCCYFIENRGYYEYQLAEQKNLTEDQIKQFEEDVRNGKDISIQNYLNNTRIDYSSSLTKKTSEVSLRLNDYLKKILKNTFKILEKLVE